jgi:hypothetical protein
VSTKTHQLIRQAIRELHIDIEPHNAVLEITTDVESPGTYKVTGKNRKGEPLEINITMDAEYRSIIAQLKEAWRGK